MSGYVPEWIQKGKPVLYKGVPYIVKDYFFTSGDGCPNSDVLNVILKGVRGAVCWPDIQPFSGRRNPIDGDLVSMRHRSALREIMRLRSAIRRHRDAKDNSRCWLNDRALYLVLPEGKDSPPITLGEEEFLKNCRAYYRRQRKDTRSKKAG